MHAKETQTPTICTDTVTVAQHTRQGTHMAWAEISLLRGRSGRREEDVSMFCRCPTTGRRIKTPRNRGAKSERKRGVARVSERQTDRR